MPEVAEAEDTAYTHRERERTHGNVVVLNDVKTL